MRCKICRKKLSDEELGISELVIAERCIPCYVAIRKVKHLLRK